MQAQHFLFLFCFASSAQHLFFVFLLLQTLVNCFRSVTSLHAPLSQPAPAPVPRTSTRFGMETIFKYLSPKAPQSEPTPPPEPPSAPQDPPTAPCEPFVVPLPDPPNPPHDGGLGGSTFLGRRGIVHCPKNIWPQNTWQVGSHKKNSYFSKKILI